MDEFADAMEMSAEPWDGGAERPAESLASETDQWDAAEENGEEAVREEQSPKDPWDTPEEKPLPEDEWDHPEEEPEPQEKPEEAETEESSAESQPEEAPEVVRLKTQVEQLEQEVREGNTLSALLEKSAKRMGLTPEGYLTHLRQRELMELGLSADGAALQAKLEQKAAEKEVQTRQKEAVEQRKKEELRRFVREFPDVKPEQISKEVWDGCRRGEGLTASYLRAENRRLQMELAAKKTEKQNQSRMLGTRRDAGGIGESDGFLNGFFSEG